MLSDIVFRKESVPGIPGPDFGHCGTENGPSTKKLLKPNMEAEIAAKSLQKPEVEEKSPQ